MMNEQEKVIITNTINQMTNQNQDTEIVSLIKILRQLSSKHDLSDDGRMLLTKLHRRQWIWGVLGVLPFFNMKYEFAGYSYFFEQNKLK